MMKKIAMAGILMAATSMAFAADCSVTVEANDAMQFNTSKIEITKSACPVFTITLKNVGVLPKAAMGHNIVVTKASDKDAIGMEALSTMGEVSHDDARVIGATHMTGGGETAELQLDTSKLEVGGAYEFFCSYPGHISIMHGVVDVK